MAEKIRKAESDNRALIALVFDATRLLRQRAVTGDGDKHALHSLSLLQLEVLRFVQEEGDTDKNATGPTMRQIADRFSIKPPSATSCIETLAALGYLKRIPDPTDRRAVRIRLTTQGARIYDQCMRQKIVGLEKLVAVLTREDKTDLARILKKIIAAYS